jgi:hypothetical protein
MAATKSSASSWNPPAGTSASPVPAGRQQLRYLPDGRSAGTNLTDLDLQQGWQ